MTLRRKVFDDLLADMRQSAATLKRRERDAGVSDWYNAGVVWTTVWSERLEGALMDASDLTPPPPAARTYGSPKSPWRD